MSMAKPEKKTPREWSLEWYSRAAEVVEVIVTEAVAYERERCAKLAESHRGDHILAEMIRRGEDHASMYGHQYVEQGDGLALCGLCNRR